MAVSLLRVNILPLNSAKSTIAETYQQYCGDDQLYKADTSALLLLPLYDCLMVVVVNVNVKVGVSVQSVKIGDSISGMMVCPVVAVVVGDGSIVVVQEQCSDKLQVYIY